MLVYSIAMLLLISAMMTASLSLATFRYRVAARQEMRIKAFWLAEAGLATAGARLPRDGATFKLGQGHVRLKVRWKGNAVTVVSTGQVELPGMRPIRRAIHAAGSAVGGRFVCRHWEEVPAG